MDDQSDFWYKVGMWFWVGAAAIVAILTFLMIACAAQNSSLAHDGTYAVSRVTQVAGDSEVKITTKSGQHFVIDPVKNRESLDHFDVDRICHQTTSGKSHAKLI